MLRAKSAQTRNLWGKEFSIVGDGLAEAEVVAFISELLQRQEHQHSLMELAQRTVIEADQLALSLRETAKSEAEAEAAGIVSHAQARAEGIAQQAQEEARAIAQHTLTEAEKLALSLRETAKSEAEAEAAGIVSHAQARAEQIAQENQETSRSVLARAEEEARAIAQHTLTEADQLALSLREKAKGEAEAEATSIVSHAQARVEEIAQQVQETSRSILAQAQEEARAIAQHTLTEAEKLALSLRETAKGEAEAEATMIVSQAQARADDIAQEVQETRQSLMAQAEEEARAITQRIYSRFMEVAQEEVGKGDGKMVGPALTAPAPYFPQPEPADPLTQKIEEALANWQAMPINRDAPPNPEGNPIPVPELVPEVPQANGEDLTDGEVDLIVAPPIDLAQLTSFQRRLRQQSQVRFVQTVGSWNQGLAITVLIKQPLPLMETLQEMPEVESVQGSNGAEKEAGKELRKRVSISLRRRPRQEAEGSGVQDDLR